MSFDPHEGKTADLLQLGISKTPEGRSATFRVEGLVVYLFFDCFFIFDLNCSTISCNISLKKTFFGSSREVLLSLIFMTFLNFFCFFHF